MGMISVNAPGACDYYLRDLCFAMGNPKSLKSKSEIKCSEYYH